MKNSIPETIRNVYDLEIKKVTEVQGGWSATAYLLASNKKSYFLKVFDKHRHSAQFWINRINYYMPILIWLKLNSSFSKELVLPIFSIDNNYKYEDDSYVYILYPYIDGIVPAEAKISLAQQKELAIIVANLHLHGSIINERFDLDIESFDVTFCDELHRILNMQHDCIELSEILEINKEKLKKNIQLLNVCADELRKCDHNFVLCHTDIHGWNLIQEKKLYLIDWEGLKYAPAEADLFSFTEGFFFDYANEQFLKTYSSVHPNFLVNEKIMEFYRIRRRLEDITEFAKNVLYDNSSKKDKLESLKHLSKECSFLRC